MCMKRGIMMNRPRIEDYETSNNFWDKELDFRKYTADLEKYTDALEKAYYNALIHLTNRVTDCRVCPIYERDREHPCEIPCIRCGDWFNFWKGICWKAD